MRVVDSGEVYRGCLVRDRTGVLMSCCAGLCGLRAARGRVDKVRVVVREADG